MKMALTLLIFPLVMAGHMCGLVLYPFFLGFRTGMVEGERFWCGPVGLNPHAPEEAQAAKDKAV
jgi:hypothetical protein